MAGDAQALLLQISADTSKATKRLDDLQKKIKGVADVAEASGARAGASLEKYFGKPSIGRALDKTFDATRFKVLDSGAARVGVFGSALESLGPIGLAAAAGIGAVAAALAEAHKAMVFADDLSDTAARLHVTTDALQEYRYAIRLAGGEESGADEALASFSETLGKASAGIPKALKGFKELGFSQADVTAMSGDTEKALELVIERISALGKTSQKDAIVGQLGLTGIKELAEGGVDALHKLMAEAKAVGVVMDSELIKRASATNEEFTTLSKVIDIELKSAVVGLIPVLTIVVKKFAEMAGFVGDIVAGFRSVEARSNKQIDDEITQLQRQQAGLAPTVSAGERAAFVAGPAGAIGATASYLKRRNMSPAQIEDRLRTLQGIKAQRVWDDAATRPGAAHAGPDLIPPTGPAGPQDQTASFGKAALDALNEANKAYLEALTALTEDIHKRSDAERAVVDADLTKQIDDLTAQEAKILASKNDSGKAEQLANVELAIIARQQAADAKKRLIDRQEYFATEEHALALAEESNRYYQATASIQAGLTQVVAERYRIERAALLHQQKIERDALTLRIERDSAEGKPTASLRAQLADLDDLQSAQRAQLLDGLTSDFKSGILGAFDAAKGGAKSLAKYFADNLSENLLDSLSQSLARLLSEAVDSSKGGGGFGSIVAAGAQLLLSHHATGSDSFGGLTRINEQGPEGVAFLPPNTQIIPNSVLRGLANLKAMPTGGGVTVVQPFHFHAEGAVLTGDILRQADLRAQQHASRALTSALNVTRRSAPGVQSKMNLLGTP